MRSMRGESGGKNRSERGDRSIHQPRQPRLHNLEKEKLFLGLFFVPGGVLGTFALVQVFGLVLVRALFLREIVEQAADAGVSGPCRRAFVKQPCLLLDRTRFVARGFQAQRTCQPDRTALDEAPHVLAPYQRNMVAKFLLIQILQTAAMAGLLLAHLFKRLGGIRKILAEFLGEIRIDALVFFFQRYGQSQQFPFRQLIEVSHVQALVAPPYWESIGKQSGRSTWKSSRPISSIARSSTELLHASTAMMKVRAESGYPGFCS